MKIFSSLLIAAVLFLAGCDTGFDPVSVTQKTELQKPPALSLGSGNSIINYDIIPLPARSPIFLDSVFTISKTIVGELGGQIILDRSYISDRGKLVTMLVNLIIPPNAFPGQRRITLTIDRNFSVVHCLPAMEFNFPLTLVQTFTGLDLQDYQAEDIDFVYIKKNGLIEEVERTSITVVKSLGILTVLNAKLNHFSRYGWVRKSE
jgi:hypothetical protein